jgi:hypothetical protein
MNNEKRYCYKSIVDGSINAWERHCDLIEAGFERVDDRYDCGRLIAVYRKEATK